MKDLQKAKIIEKEIEKIKDNLEVLTLATEQKTFKGPKSFLTIHRIKKKWKKDIKSKNLVGKPIVIYSSNIVINRSLDVDKELIEVIKKYYKEKIREYKKELELI